MFGVKHRTKYRPCFDNEEKKIFFDLVERFRKDVISHHRRKLKGSIWNTFAREYNSLMIRQRSPSHLKMFWDDTREKLHKKLAHGRLLSINTLSAHEIRALKIMPHSYFADLFSKKQFYQFLKEVSEMQVRQNTSKKITKTIDKSFDESKFEILFEEDGQNPCNSKYLTEDHTSNDGETMDAENSDPLDLPWDRNVLSSDNDQESFDGNFIKNENVVDLDVTVVLSEDSLSDETTSLSSIPMEKTGNLISPYTLEMKEISPSGSVGTLRCLNDAVGENSTMVQNLFSASNLSEEDSTLPSIINVQSLTSEQFNESDQISDCLTLVDIVSPENVLPNSLLDKSVKTTPNFPNAIFEFEHDDAQNIISTPAKSLAMPPVCQDNSFCGKEYMKKRMEMELFQFHCEMNTLSKERECIDRRHQSKMKVLQFELDTAASQFRDGVLETQIRRAIARFNS